MRNTDKIFGHRLDRTLFTHSVLFSVAETALARGQKHSDRSDYLTAIVMAAFSFEAYLNFVGEKLFAFWGDVEHIPVRSKLSVICKSVRFLPDYGKRPYQSLVELWRIRNILAHARTEILSVVRDGPPPEPLEYPETDWEKQCTLKTAKRLLDDVRDVIHDLHRRTGMVTGALGQFTLQGGEILRKKRPDE